MPLAIFLLLQSPAIMFLLSCTLLRFQIAAYNRISCCIILEALGK